MPETWYAHPDDLIGGWAVMNRDHRPSALNYDADPDAREVANFMCEEDARRIAALHNADLAGSLLPEGGETCTEWGPRCSDPSHGGLLFVHEEMVAREAVDGYGARREVREWPDGSSFTGPWVAVDQPKKD